MTARILVADDEDSLRWVLEKGLRQAGYEVSAVKDGDLRGPGLRGGAASMWSSSTSACLASTASPRSRRLREIRADACVVVMTAHGTMDTAIQAMQRGAYDYLAKPFDLDEVLPADRARA